MDFKIGDIVLCVCDDPSNDLIKNKLGKVVVRKNTFDNLCIEFFEHIQGHDGYLKNSKTKKGHCWYVEKTYLIKINTYKLQKLLEK